jgi:FtsH Extracellular
MADVAQSHQKRSWYKRPLVWIAFVIVAALVVFGAREVSGGPATIRYSDFLDQLDAGNIASVNFSGTRIDGHFKQPVAEKDVNNGAPLTVFRSQAPDFGDPTLLPELRKERVAIGVGSSQLLGTGAAAALGIVGAFLLAKPMLLIIAAALIAGLFKVARGGKVDFRAILSMVPMFRSVSALNGKKSDADGDSPRDGS